MGLLTFVLHMSYNKQLRLAPSSAISKQIKLTLQSYILFLNALKDQSKLSSIKPMNAYPKPPVLL